MDGIVAVARAVFSIVADTISDGDIGHCCRGCLVELDRAENNGAHWAYASQATGTALLLFRAVLFDLVVAVAEAGS